METNQSPTTADLSPDQAPSRRYQGYSTAERLLCGEPEVSVMLGVSTKTIKRMVAEGSIPGVVHVRGRRLFNLAEVRKWVAAGCPALPETTTQAC